ncbi:NAD(P)-binding domain-containing protein [Brevibacillus choshinensis]|uniref:Pyrroline-5-carboxylate reductase n=1 Tax=Brevibacillus choshinensis TaxID=54911 RepID=A0ABX7FRU2_BRECH|nr:NAD(P)-binding domain-containing protein [Brevibacillus choshinensis]QRG68520.1 NAD(P)-binding domain-containing protein [Brevibacillus choshinensis]
MNIGIIGLGSIGQMLVKAFCKSGAAAPEKLMVFNRTQEKAEQLQAEYKLAIGKTAQEVCDHSDVVFVCTKPLDILPLLRELTIPARTHVVSVAAGVSIADLEGVHTGAVSKVIPTVTSQELRGVSLYACSQRLTPEQREHFLTLLSSISVPQEISEQAIETATILTSSAPGLIAGILESFAQAAVRKTPELSIDLARHMLVETMLGTAMLLQKEQLGFDQLIERVATKGGITEEGLRVLDKTLPAGFDELFAMTESKHDRLKQLVQQQNSAQ